MPDLTIRIKKKIDGSAALSCTRADGTVTWQRQDGQLGQFFPLHDLTHLAVESVLGLRRAFYGLLVEGWDITSFPKPEFRDKLPHDALFAELIVGYFDLERRTGERPTADELNEKAAAYFSDNGQPAAPFQLSQGQVERIRAVRGEHFARWTSLASGDALELPFDCATPARAPATQTGRRHVG
jgi:hypothetical protein